MSATIFRIRNLQNASALIFYIEKLSKESAF